VPREDAFYQDFIGNLPEYEVLDTSWLSDRFLETSRECEPEVGSPGLTRSVLVVAGTKSCGESVFLDSRGNGYLASVRVFCSDG
jgi:hypothetical protein